MTKENLYTPVKERHDELKHALKGTDIKNKDVVELSIGKELSGSILDIGGGGEGIIGLAYGEQVTAIDISQEELDEAPGGFTKICMDEAHMTFQDGCFDNVTFFFSLMFMDKSS